METNGPPGRPNAPQTRNTSGFLQRCLAGWTGLEAAPSGVTDNEVVLARGRQASQVVGIPRFRENAESSPSSQSAGFSQILSVHLLPGSEDGSRTSCGFVRSPADDDQLNVGPLAGTSGLATKTGLWHAGPSSSCPSHGPISLKRPGPILLATDTFRPPRPCSSPRLMRMLLSDRTP